MRCKLQLWVVEWMWVWQAGLRGRSAMISTGGVARGVYLERRFSARLLVP